MKTNVKLILVFLMVVAVIMGTAMGQKAVETLDDLAVQTLAEEELEIHHPNEEVATAQRWRVKGSHDRQRLRRLYMQSLTPYCSKNGRLAVNHCFWCKRALKQDNIMISDLYNEASHTYGYVAYEPTYKRLNIAFRGTVNLKNWLTNVDALYADFGGLKRVHKGFLKAYQNVRPQLKAAIRFAKEKYVINEVYVMGHSLGGALAVLSIEEIAHHFKAKQVHLITFGAPRVGNIEFVQYIHRRVKEATRVINYRDPVPHLPSRHFNTFTGRSLYFHTGIETYLKGTQMQECPSEEICAKASLLPSVNAHLSYFDVSTKEAPEC